MDTLQQILSSQSLTLIEPITSQSLNECYHVRAQDDYFLKILTSKRSEQERRQELEIQKLASASQRSPELIYSEHHEQYTWMLMRFYHSLGTPTLAQQVSCLKQFHALPATHLRAINPLALAQDYLVAARDINPQHPAIKILAAHLPTLALPPIAQVGLCHFDAHPYNFLLTKDHVYLIDFENSGVFDPLYDLAVLAFYSGFDDKQLQAMLTLYDPHYSVHELNICQSYQTIILVLFLAYLTYRLALEDFILVSDAMILQTPSQKFQQLIKSYYLAKAPHLQKVLEQELLALGISHFSR